MVTATGAQVLEADGRISYRVAARGAEQQREPMRRNGSVYRCHWLCSSAADEVIEWKVRTERGRAPAYAADHEIRMRDAYAVRAVAGGRVIWPTS